MKLCVVIERACDGILKQDGYEVNAMHKETRLSFQAQAIVKNVYNYFVQLEKCSGSRGP